MAEDTKNIVTSINYSNMDFEKLRQDLIDLIPKLNSEWTNLNDTDLGITLINVFAGVGDMLSYYLNEQAKETYLPTAQLRQSIIDATKIIGYRLARPTSASTDLTITFDAPLKADFDLFQYEVFTTTNGETDFVVAEDMKIAAGTSSFTVRVYQGTPRTESFTSTGAPLQEYPISSKTISENMMIALVGEDNELYEELQKDIYLQSNKDNLYFETITDAFDNTKIRFSKSYGRYPRSGQSIRVTYLDTYGASGNVASGMIVKPQNPYLFPQNATVTQPIEAKGGTEREDINFTKIQAPREIRTLWRAVTPEDYETLIEGYPGVLNSSVFDYDKDPKIPINQVVCVIAPDGGGLMSLRLKEELTEFTNRIKMTTTNVVLKDADYVSLTIDANIYVLSNYVPNDVVQNVRAALKKEFSIEKLDFGEPIRLSKIVSTIQGVKGVSFVELVSPIADIELTPYQIAALAEPKITVAGVV